MDVCTATTFLRQNRPLRALLLDNRPWFVASDLARLLGLNHPNVLARRMETYEVRQVSLLNNSGSEEDAEVINESALYKAVLRHSHPENRVLLRWLNEKVIPLLRDQSPTHPEYPRRLFMNWNPQRVTVLEWQDELWVPISQLPTFTEAPRGKKGWRGLWRR
ncbi:BRO family protein [Pseudomonas sp. SCB32]|uniref:BRO-N domain-containing protein n=1 Tax=Pseudomonas sp. SCB32 TaxID=2653853 RepID=UPI001264B9E6|nr:BRO family protein [Pseudomonas sp. SCB32]